MNHLTKQKIVLYLATIFAAGGISGAVVAWGTARNKMFQPSPKAMRPPSMRDVCDHMKTRLQSRLNLTKEQLRKIEPILAQTAKEMETIHQQSMEQIEQAIEKSNAEIAKELTAEQKIKLAELEKERRDFLQKRFKGERPSR